MGYKKDNLFFCINILLKDPSIGQNYFVYKIIPNEDYFMLTKEQKQNFTKNCIIINDSDFYYSVLPLPTEIECISKLFIPYEKDKNMNVYNIWDVNYKNISNSITESYENKNKNAIYHNFGPKVIDKIIETKEVSIKEDLTNNIAIEVKKLLNGYKYEIIDNEKYITIKITSQNGIYGCNLLISGVKIFHLYKDGNSIKKTLLPNDYVEILKCFKKGE